MRPLKYILPLIALFAIPLQLSAKPIVVSTKSITIVLEGEIGERLSYLYFGSKINSDDIRSVVESNPMKIEAYPTYGLSGQAEPALSVIHHDGGYATRLLVEEVKTYRDAQSSVTEIRLKDQFYPFYTSLFYRAYDDADVIETWSEITNKEKGSVLLDRFYSGSLPIRRGDVWLSYLHGSWANESRLSEQPLSPGHFVISNKDGVRNAQRSHAEIMLSLDGKPQNSTGANIGAILCYSGNYKVMIQTDDSDYHRLFAGINEENSRYTLKKNETFTTPVLALTYSNQGTNGVSQQIHKWARNFKVAHGDRPRDILLNSWEGVYFDMNEQNILQMIDDIADFGGELFVLDDGWFGTKYQRLTDNTALGDWKVDKKKLPNGLEALIQKCKERGIKFGIWVEPEMTNTKSELYETHPDWVLKAHHHDPITGRGGTQLVLDLCNPTVQDFVYKVFDNLLTQYPDIAYIKWDSNMSVENHGSQYLKSNEQSHLFIEWHRGLEKICQRIRDKYPDLTIQVCASGGARANYGLLPYFDEFWVSDNSEALQRVYMQWGASYFFPAITMASHISSAPNHQTFRSIPLKYRIDVAMSGRLGLEMQPQNMNSEERQLCKAAFEQYKKIRPVVQLGDLYRLQSPYEKKGVASLMYVSEDKNEATFFWWKIEHSYNQHLPIIKMEGLDPNRSYRITELNRIDLEPLPFEGKSFTGHYLMSNGLEIPYNHKLEYHKLMDYSSRVLYLEAIDK